ncbi:MAG: lytic transglycosylase domain-containing protein [Deltaproteobacteria bacterium]|nr:lytic transglycosylase domain-containing protein [Deltaproteobacteria bacterium]
MLHCVSASGSSACGGLKIPYVFLRLIRLGGLPSLNLTKIEHFSKVSHWRALRLCFVLLLTVVTPLWADIYRWVDASGTMHFTNVPTSAKYEVYIRESLPAGVHPASRYDRYVREAAERFDVPFSLIKAIIRAESDFDARAVSASGARGLMQIMPETARDLGIRDCFDPRDNILGGVRYFRALLDQFNGSIPLALAAYNAGPNRIGPLREVPRIEETERFVRKVMEFFYSY